MKIEDYAINMIDNLPIEEAIKVVSYYDSRPLTYKILKELGFDDLCGCGNKDELILLHIKIGNDIKLYSYKNKGNNYIVYMDTYLMGDSVWRTVGSVKMLIEALKRDGGLSEMSSYDQGYTCVECEHLYDDTDGDMDERMCNECLDKIYAQEQEEKRKKRVKSAMEKVAELINAFTGEIK